MKVVILGSGTSTGVPVLGCSCPVCKSHDPKDQRTRASLALLHENGKNIVIDTGPEFRLQLLRAGIGDLDAVLYTHTHADHCHGFDDLRAFSFNPHRKTIDCYLLPEHMADFKERFKYAFETTGYEGAVPMTRLKEIPCDTFLVSELEIEPVKLPHGHMTTCGFRIGNFAYATDFKGFPEDVIKQWRGKVDFMVASGIHFGQHKTHNVIPETLTLFERLGVKRGWISHLSHKVDYKRDRSRLPAHVDFSYDGMVIDLTSNLKYQ
jgi:phosphoribosyl 1,2-cyclic phosphate phosphodiesterase